jgi:hypothetical protein
MRGAPQPYTRSRETGPHDKDATPIIAVLLIVNVALSAYAAAIAPTPTHLCQQLQQLGLVHDCQAGTPWAFEITRHGDQQRFLPTNPELFGCYRFTAGTWERCQFEGAITQFASDQDLRDGLAQISAAHHHPNLDPKSDVVSADTTLEHHMVYVYAKHRLLILMPMTEHGIAVQQAVESLLGPSD